MPQVLTLDLGTTNFKACLFDEHGQLVALHRQSPVLAQNLPGTWELNPRVFFDTVQNIIHEVGRQSPTGLNAVEAITFATQANSFILLDQNKQPLTPLILWPDARATELDIDWHAWEPKNFRKRTGIPQLPYPAIPPKLVWLRTKRPDIYARAAHICNISDFLTLALTGQQVTEAGVAGLSCLLDIKSIEWWPEMVAKLQLDPCVLGKVVRAGTDLGPILPEVAEKLGLPNRCRFIVGCLDQYAGAIGVGNIRAHRVSETTGTVLATVTCAHHVAEDLDPAIFQGPGFMPDFYFRMSFGSTSANLLEWYHDQLPDRPDFSTLSHEASLEPYGAGDLTILPYVENLPIDSCFARIPPKARRGQVVQAIMHAVAHALDGQVKALCTRGMPQEIRSAGGAARSDLWLQIKADILKIPFIATACDEPTSLGAAILAGQALGLGSVPELCSQWIRQRATFQPK